jgi:hypothetical protein
VTTHRVVRQTETQLVFELRDGAGCSPTTGARAVPKTPRKWSS